MIYKTNMSEEAYKQAVANEVFLKLNYIPNYGASKIDFVIADKNNDEKHLFWAETKNKKTDIYAMLTQLLLTAKKTYQSGEITPPPLIGCFDPETFAFFNFADFIGLYNRGVADWGITPSNHSGAEFKKFQKIVEATANPRSTFHVKTPEGVEELKDYVKKNIGRDGEQLTLFEGSGDGLEITLTNLQRIFNIWMDEVKPQIAVSENEWKDLQQNGVYPSDFFLADVYGDAETGNTEIAEMKVIFRNGEYRVGENIGAKSITPYDFKDKHEAHRNFWGKYKRPPRSAKIPDEKITPYNEILERKDLLVPHDIMGQKGAFFTPPVLVEKAHEAIEAVLGKDWQKNYYVWDCACGTGNLLAGLTNRKNLFASTIDESDVRIIHEILKGLIFKENAFQFDFLNDSFDKLPEKLRKIIESPEERGKLIVLINPPYTDSSANILKTKGKKAGSSDTRVKEQYSEKLEGAANELFMQFLIRIYCELGDCYIAEFSKLKLLFAPKFRTARRHFQAKLLSCFIVPAEMFDNVEGNFPIGFKIWDTKIKEPFENIEAAVYNKKVEKERNKYILNYDGKELISPWMIKYNSDENIGSLNWTASDFQQQSLTSVENRIYKGHYTKVNISNTNLDKVCVFFAVRWAIKADWLNDRDQFLAPVTQDFDADFVNDCLIYTIFDGQNHISAEHGENHWIPFSEEQCGSEEEFQFDTVYTYLSERNIPEALTAEARAVYNKALEIFRYYHERKGWGADGRSAYNCNAALYDIRAFFQGRNNKGKMNAKSPDAKYQGLIEGLREDIKILRVQNIAPKVYEYGFLV